MSIFKKIKASKAYTRGFTLVELLVSITIFAIVTGLVLAKTSGFNGTVVLTSLSYDVALQVREAQAYGINVKLEPGAGNSQFQYGYGVDFDTSNPTVFVMYQDFTDDKLYQSATPNETLRTTAIKRGVKISCVSVNGGTCTTGKLDIEFIRPSPTAWINGAKSNSEGYVKLIAPDGSTKSIVVSSTGQISVEDR